MSALATEADRLRAALVEAAAAGDAPTRAADLRAVLERIDATVLPRRLRLGPAGPDLTVAERRVVAVDGADVGLEDPGTVAGLLDRVADAVEIDEGPALAQHRSPGVSAAALAEALGVVLWRDRSLPARLEAWVAAAGARALAARGYGALAEAGVDWGDPAALEAAIGALAPDGPEALAARGLGGPAGIAGTEVGLGLVAVAGAGDVALVVAGSAEGGIVVLAQAGDLLSLIRDWQAT